LNFGEVILNFGEPLKVDTNVAMELIENNDFGPWRSVEDDH